MDSHTSFDIKPRSVTLTQVIPSDVDVLLLNDRYTASYDIHEFLEVSLPADAGEMANATYEGHEVYGVLYKNVIYSTSDVYLTFATYDPDFTQTLTISEIMNYRSLDGVHIKELLSVSILAEVEEY